MGNKRNERYKRARAKMKYLNEFDIPSELNSFVTLMPPSVVFSTTAYVPQEEKENTMYLDTKVNLETQQKNYALSRIDSLYYNAENMNSKKYGLVDDDIPEDIFEALKRIDAKKFTLPKDLAEADKISYNWYNQIKWRDPDLKKDLEGYNAKMDEVRKSRVEATDQITFSTVDQYEKILKDFESKTVN